MSAGAEPVRGVAFTPLLEAAHPDLYRRNAFRVTGLPVDASGRDVARRADRLKLMEKLATAGGESRGALALDPPPDGDAIREALRRLHDPEDRIVDELFWFWPAERSAGDAALRALASGDLATAQRLWQEQATSSGPAALAARHDLAVLAHLQALESEDGPEAEAGQHNWEEAIRRWRQLTVDPDLRERLRQRLVELADPRLTPDHVDAIVSSLPRAVLAISADLAARAAERGSAERAARHLGHLDLWDTPPAEEVAVAAPVVPEAPRCAVCDGPVDTTKLVGQIWCPACKKTVKARGGARRRKPAAGPRRSPLVVETLHRVLEPQRQRIKTLCASAEAEADRDPVHADALVGRLLEQTAPLLRVLDTLLEPGDLMREGAHDEVALKALGCQIVYGNKTQDWRRCVELLGPVLATAASASSRQRIQDNLDIVRKNAETGGDWCAAGYYDLPAPVLEIAERCRARAESQEWEEAIGPLVGLYMGRSCGELDETPRRIVGQALASALNKRSMARLKPAMAIASEPPAIIARIAERAGRSDHHFLMTATAARLGIAGQAEIEIHCMACGTRIWSRFYRFTFKDIPCIVCAECNDRDDREREGRRNRMRDAISSAAEDLVVAEDLAPDDTAIRENLDGLRKFGSDVGIKLPSVHRTRMQLGLAGLPELLKALRQGSSDERARAAEALGHGQDGSGKAIPALIHALGDGDKDVRRAASVALSRQGAPAAAALAAALDHDKPPVREGAAAALRTLGAAASDEVTLALRHAHSRVRALASSAAIGLGRAAVPTLLMVLRDPEPEVRAAALGALGEIGDPRAIAPLVRLLADPEAGLVTQAPAALAQIDARWASSEGAREALPELVEGLGAEGVKTRRAAAQALGVMGPAASSAGPQLAAATHDAHKEVRAAAAEALGAQGDPAAIRVLAALLADPAGAVSTAAQKALKRIDEAWARQPAAIEAVPDLVRGLQGAETAARLACVQALHEIGRAAHTAGPALVAALHDADAEVREAVAGALPAVSAPTPAVVRGLVGLLADPLAPPRRAAARALGLIAAAARGAGPALAEAAVKDRDEEVRTLAFAALEKVDPARATAVVRQRRLRRLAWASAAAAVLAVLFLGGSYAGHLSGDPLPTRILHGMGLLGPAQTRPVYDAALSSTNSAWRINAAWGLGALGAADAREPLLLLLLDPDPHVRRAADQALRRIDPAFALSERDVPVFVEQLGDASSARRAAAARLLGSELGPAAASASAALLPLAEDPDPQVREAVRDALERITPGWRQAAEAPAPSATDASIEGAIDGGVPGGVVGGVPEPLAAADTVLPAASARAELIGEWDEYWNGMKNSTPIRILDDRGALRIEPIGGQRDRYHAVTLDGGWLRYVERGPSETMTVTLQRVDRDRWSGPIVSNLRGQHLRELRRRGIPAPAESTPAVVAEAAPPAATTPAGDSRGLAGTTWVGARSNERYEFTFHGDGSLEYSAGAGRYRNGTWRQDGNRIYMEMNKKYAEYDGTISGDRIDGTGGNTTGLRWTWWAERQGAGRTRSGTGPAAAAPPPAALSPAASALVGTWNWNSDAETIRPDGSGTYFRDKRACYEFRWTLSGDTFTSTADRSHSCGASREASFRVAVRGNRLIKTHVGSGFESQWLRGEPPPATTAGPVAAEGSFKRRAEFGSDEEYGRYVKGVLTPGARVRARVDYGLVKSGMLGTYHGVGTVPPCFVTWDEVSGSTSNWLPGVPENRRGKQYWVEWHMVDLVAPAPGR